MGEEELGGWGVAREVRVSSEVGRVKEDWEVGVMGAWAKGVVERGVREVGGLVKGVGAEGEEVESGVVVVEVWVLAGKGVAEEGERDREHHHIIQHQGEGGLGVVGGEREATEVAGAGGAG